MITDLGKSIYNHYLRALRVNNDKPYRLKKNFDGFETEPEYLYVMRLEEFFKKYPHLLKNDFFDAPYKLYRDESKYFTLKYYASYKGLKTCIEYYKSLLKDNPDNQLDFIKESLQFIMEFCLEKGIQVDDYPFYKSVTQCDFLKHLKEHRISWYVAVATSNMYVHLYKMEPDEFELYFGSEVNLSDLQYRLNTSSKARNMIEVGHKKIKDFVAKSLKKSSKSGKIG